VTDRWILRVVFARPDFRRLLSTRLASQCGDGVFQASLAGAVLFNPERQANPASIAAGFTVLLLPYSFVGPFAGVLLDRWSRQRVLVVASLVRCALVALVAAETSAGLTGLPFYASALLVISVNRFFLAALSAALPHVVEGDAQLVTANSTSTTCGSLATTAGAGLALGLLGLLGSSNHAYAAVALAATLGYGGAAAVGRGFGRDQLGPDDVERERRETLAAVARGLAAGARHVAERRTAFLALVAIGGHRLFYGISFVVTLLLYRNYFVDDGFFRAGVTGLGQAVLATAVGGLVAASVTPPGSRRVGKPTWIAGSLALAAVAQLIAGLPYSMQALLPGAIVLGFVAQGAKICVDTIVQEEVDDEFRGRVFSLYDTLFNVAFVAACVFTAFTVPSTGRSYPMLALVVTGYALTSLFYLNAARRLGRTRARAELVPESVTES
jgi:MFS family permease